MKDEFQLLLGRKCLPALQHAVVWRYTCHFICNNATSSSVAGTHRHVYLPVRPFKMGCTAAPWASHWPGCFFGCFSNLISWSANIEPYWDSFLLNHLFFPLLLLPQTPTHCVALGSNCIAKGDDSGTVLPCSCFLMARLEVQWRCELVVWRKEHTVRNAFNGGVLPTFVYLFYSLEEMRITFA